MKLKLEDLKVLLLSPETWPQDFQWDYTDYKCCAMGLMAQVGWVEDLETFTGTSEFGITQDQSHQIFCGANYEVDGLDYYDIKPEHVAQVIDRVLAEKKKELLA